MRRTHTPLIVGLVAGLAFSAHAAKFLPYPEPIMKYPTERGWDSAIGVHWTNWKKNFLKNGIVQGKDPANNPRTISEGQSYGMLMAIWMNDKAAFDATWAATETQLWNSGSGWYKWTPSDPNYAGDADIDICGALIFASKLVEKGYWTDNTSPAGSGGYKGKAKIVLQSIVKNFIDVNNNYRINSWPGAGDGIRNPSYHMPQWYPIFKEFDSANKISSMDWDKATAGAHAFLKAQPNSSYGMARNFSDGSGGTASGGTSSLLGNDATYDRNNMGFDAIRVPYRMGMAAMWYPKDSKAVSWCKSVWSGGKVLASKAGMYDVSTVALAGWGTSAQGYADAAYEKPMTAAMWGTAAVAVKDSSAQAATAAATLGSYLNNPVKLHQFLTTWAAEGDPNSPETNYFAQSLGMLGIIAMNGRAWNVWDDLTHPWVAPDTATKMTMALSATPASVALGTNTLIRGKFSKAVNWTLTLTGKTSGAYYSINGTTDSVNLTWNSGTKKLTSKPFVAEVVDVVLTGGWNGTMAGTSTTVTLTGSSIGIQDRFVKAGGLLWNGSVLRVNSAELVGDQDYEVRVLDMTGRVLRSEHQTARGVEGGVEFSMARPSVGSGLQLLDVRSATGLRVQSVLPLLAR